jgi:hypothetical protein
MKEAEEHLYHKVGQVSTVIVDHPEQSIPESMMKII